MEDKRFKKNDEGFMCRVCGFEVPPLKYSSRDHCPKCLSSIHIDVLPGDRKNECQGTLVPIQTLPDAEKGFIIVDSNCMTNIENVYACGDVIKKSVYQLTTAASEGTIAANSIIKKNKK